MEKEVVLSLAQLSAEIRNLQYKLDRSIFESKLKRVNKVLLKSGVVMPYDSFCMQSTLMMDATVSPGDQRIFFFPIRGTGDSVFLTDILLGLTDIFVVTGWSLLQGAPEGLKTINYNAACWGDPYIFYAGTTPQSAELLYQSKLQVAINNQVVLKDYYTGMLRSERGIVAVDVDPFLVLVGTQNVVINLELPEPMPFSLTHHRAKLVLHGFLVMNATVLS